MIIRFNFLLMGIILGSNKRAKKIKL